MRLAAVSQRGVRRFFLGAPSELSEWLFEKFESETVQGLCLNPYIACRKDAFGVSDVIVQSSIVTGLVIGTLVTVQSLI